MYMYVWVHYNTIYLLQDSKGHHDRELKAAKQRLIAAQKGSESVENNAGSLKQDMETRKLEVDELETSVNNQKEQVLHLT